MKEPRSQSGSSALEFALVVPLCISLMFGIFDLGRYLLTRHSLDTLASATARAVIINCGMAGTNYGKLVSGCALAAYGLTDTQSRDAAPFLYVGGQLPTVVISCGTCTATGQITITASLASFTFILPWDTLSNNAMINALARTTSLYY